MDEQDEPRRWDSEWGPARNLWAAQIIIDGQNAPDRRDLLVRQVTWASHGEALDFLVRAMPKTTIPEDLDHPRRRRVAGEIHAAKLYTKILCGEVVEWTVVDDEINLIAYMVGGEVRSMLVPRRKKRAAA